VLAWPLAGLTAAVLVTVLVLLGLNARRVGPPGLASDAILAVAIGVGAAVGQLIIGRRPRNAIGWLLGLIALSLAASTLAAAALFTPLRSRVQRVVDRRFNRTRYDADRTVSAFAARLKDAVDQDAVRADLLGVIQRSLEPTHATVWVRPIR